MPHIDLHRQRALVHATLKNAELVVRSGGELGAPRLAELLTASSHAVWYERGGANVPPETAWISTEAAFQLVSGAGYALHGHTDPRLPGELDRLDNSSLAVKLSAFETAAARTAERPPAARTSSLTPWTATAGRNTRRARPCSCACRSGGFCGGCGHAGCGGR